MPCMESFKIFFAKHNLSSFKFSTKVWERAMLVNTPILDELNTYRQNIHNVQPKAIKNMQYPFLNPAQQYLYIIGHLYHSDDQHP